MQKGSRGFERRDRLPGKKGSREGEKGGRLSTPGKRKGFLRGLDRLTKKAGFLGGKGKKKGGCLALAQEKGRARKRRKVTGGGGGPGNDLAEGPVDSEWEKRVLPEKSHLPLRGGRKGRGIEKSGRRSSELAGGRDPEGGC